MASFVKLDGANKVVAAVSVHNDVAPTEEAGALFLNKLYNTSDVWKQTSYNTQGGVHALGGTPFRKNFAGVGFTYDEGRDAFISEKPYPSWIFNESKCDWDPPVARPTEPVGQVWNWDEATNSWVPEE